MLICTSCSLKHRLHPRGYEIPEQQRSAPSAIKALDPVSGRCTLWCLKDIGRVCCMLFLICSSLFPLVCVEWSSVVRNLPGSLFLVCVSNVVLRNGFYISGYLAVDFGIVMCFKTECCCYNTCPVELFTSPTFLSDYSDCIQLLVVAPNQRWGSFAPRHIRRWDQCSLLPRA